MYVDVTIAVESRPFLGFAFPFNFEMKGVKEETISQTIFSPPVAKEIKSAAAELLGIYAEDIHDFLCRSALSRKANITSRPGTLGSTQTLASSK